MYYGVDNSYFVCECLLQEAEEMAISNFSMLNMQIESLSRSDLPNEIVGIRAKNVRTYLVDYLSIMPVHYSWLADGGKLFIQEYAWKHTPKDILTVFEPTLELLHGSELSLIPGDPTNKFDVHTLEVTKNF
jgi:hypothetical protein